jgi:hypothetical protein
VPPTFRTDLSSLVNPLETPLQTYLEVSFTNLLGAFQSNQVDNQG